MKIKEKNNIVTDVGRKAAPLIYNWSKNILRLFDRQTIFIISLYATVTTAIENISSCLTPVRELQLQGYPVTKILSQPSLTK